MSSVALAVCTARDFTSDATTAKPLPASPARAASMVALSASKFVCPAILRISLTTSPIFCAPSARPAISPSVARASLVASPTTLLVCVSWRLISPIDRDSSSAATAAVSTFAEASLKACTALSARCEVCSDEPNKARAVERMAAALLLLAADGGAFLLGLTLLRYVLVCRDPTAASQRLVLGEHDAAIACLYIM